MGLTVTEKEHWKNRLERRIDQTIKATYASSDAGFLERTMNSARIRAVESLGLTKSEAKLAEIKQSRTELDREERALHRLMVAHVRKCAIEEIGDDYHYYPCEVRTAIKLRQDVHEKEVLAETVAGQQILKLRKEKEELLDTVWLATSGKQIKQLWERVSVLLVEEPTLLQAEALSIEPLEEG